MGFGKFVDIMEIDSTKFVGPAKFWRREVFENGYGEVLYFCLFIVTFCNVKHNPSKSHKL